MSSTKLPSVFDREEGLTDTYFKAAEPISKCVERNSEPGDHWSRQLQEFETAAEYSQWNQKTENHFHKDRIFPQIELQIPCKDN